MDRRGGGGGRAWAAPRMHRQLPKYIYVTAWSSGCVVLCPRAGPHPQPQFTQSLSVPPHLPDSTLLPGRRKEETAGGPQGARTLPSGRRASWPSALVSGRRWRIGSLGRGHQEVASGGSAGQRLVIWERGRPQREGGSDWAVWKRVDETTLVLEALGHRRNFPAQNRGARPRSTEEAPRPWAAGLAMRLPEGGCGCAGASPGKFVWKWLLRTGLVRARCLGRDRIRGAGRGL